MKKYKILNKNKIREDILSSFKNNELSFNLCNICSGEKCYLELKNKEECFQPMREMYDEKYALEG